MNGITPVSNSSLSQSPKTLGQKVAYLFGQYTIQWLLLIAVIILGVVGTGIARALAATLAGRVGGPRMSSTTYLVPIVAIALGVVFLGERGAPVAIVGVVVVFAGAYWTTRAVPATISPGSASARAGSD